MPTLPSDNEFIDAATTESTFKTKYTQMLAFLRGLLGSDGSAATAQSALGIPDATNRLYSIEGLLGTDGLPSTARVKLGLGGAVINYNNTGPWANATAYNVNDLVTETGIVYVCQTQHTSSVFASDLNAGYWTIHQGISRAELSAASGSSLMGHTPDGPDPVAKTTYQALLDLKHVFGQEHLSAVQKLMLSTTAVTAIASGDSTTSGAYNIWPGPTGGTLPTQFMIHRLISDAVANKGIVGVNVINKGHSGFDTNQWAADPSALSADIAIGPDLYILRWGINDKSHGRTAAQFNADLRAGLTTLRATLDNTMCSVILMVPNAIYDISTGRDNSWIEQIRPYIRQAAIDYKCCYIDTAGILGDAVNSSDYMDKDPITGKAIHPKEVMNVAIAELIANVLVPDSIRTVAKNVYTDTNEIVLSTDLPTAYGDGISVRTSSGSGWAMTSGGPVITHKSRNGRIIQQQYSTTVINGHHVKAERYSYDALTWTKWDYGNPSITYFNSWAAGVVPLTCNIRTGVVSISGAVIAGNLTVGTKICNIGFAAIGLTMVKSVWQMCRSGAPGSPAEFGVSSNGDVFYNGGSTTGPFWINITAHLSGT